MNAENRKAILGPMRLPFLVLPPVCVLLGVGTAVWSGFEINVFLVIIAFIGAVAAHVAVNSLNEYADFKSGLDFKTEPTPFSGGSKTLPENPKKANVALMTGLISLLIITTIGIYVWSLRGFGIVPLGLLGLFVIAAYTPWLTKNPFLCLIAPGLGFGPLMVMGTAFALTGTYSWTAFIASLVPFFLVSDLLLLNQFPDVDADKTVGRKNVLIWLGKKPGVWIYALFLAGAYLALVVGYLAGIFPLFGLIGMLTLLLAVPTVIGVAKNHESIPDLIPFMGKNVVLNIITPVLVAIGLFI